MYVSCPFCGKQYEVKQELAGRKARCSNPACKKTFVLPVLAQPEEPSVPPSGKAGVAAAGAPGGPAPNASAPGVAPVAGPLDALLAAELGTPGTPGVGSPTMPGPSATPGAGAQPGMGVPAAGPLGVPLGPPAYLYRRRRRRWVRPALIGAGAGVAVAALVFIVMVVARAFQGGGVSQATGSSGLAGNGLPTWAAFCVPPEAKAVGYVNIDKIRQSAAMQAFERLVPKTRQPVNLRARITPLKDALFVGGPQASVVVLRTRDDLSLETIAATLTAAESPPGSGDTPPISSHAGTSYVRFSGGYVAKLASCTYCLSDRESELKQALDRSQRSEAPPLSAELREALKNIPSGDHFLAVVAEGLPEDALSARMMGALPRDADFRWIAAAGYVDSSIRGTVAVEFKGSEQPAKLKADFDKGQQELAAQVGTAPPHARPMLQKLVELFRGLQVSHSGSRLTVKFNFTVKSIEELAQLAER